MQASEQSNPRHSVVEVAALVGQLLLILVFLCALVAGPVVLSRWVSPWVGAVAALAGLGLWVRFGPRPMPGLLPGLLCIWGCGVMLATFIACVIRGVRDLLA